MDFVRFESTIWTVIKKAQENDKTAIETFVSKYRPPVIKFITKKGFSGHDAEDIAQDVFLRIFNDKLLEKADKAKGRFRSLILAVTKNQAGLYKQKKDAQKRGGKDEIISIDETSVEDLLTCDEKDDEFDKLWIHNILKIAIDQLKNEHEDDLYFKALDLFSRGKSYEKIAASLGKDYNDVKNYIYKARLKLKEYIKEEILTYSCSRKDFDDELRYLSSYLEKHGASTNSAPS